MTCGCLWVCGQPLRTLRGKGKPDVSLAFVTEASSLPVEKCLVACRLKKTEKRSTMGQDARLHWVTPFPLFALLSAEYL